VFEKHLDLEIKNHQMYLDYDNKFVSSPAVSGRLLLLCNKQHISGEVVGPHLCVLELNWIKE